MAEELIALVTGGGRGIGRAIALALADDGVDVALAARTVSELDAVAVEVRSRGQRALALPLDVTTPAAITAAMIRCRSELGPIAILVNNAGVALSSHFLALSLEQWEHTLRVDLTAAFLCAQSVLPTMLEAGFGRIINIASTAAKVGFRYTTAYTAAKHGLLGLTRALALEVAGTGVTVNAVCPGFTNTAIVDDAAANIAKKSGRSESEARAELASLSPLNRLIEPEEVAAVVAHLARGESGSINGQAWNVDGGSVVG